MLAALTLPVLIALFLVVMERLEARVFGPYAEVAGAPPAADPGPLPGEDGDEADVDPQAPGGLRGGPGPWTHR
jgi:hypothetical protein